MNNIRFLREKNGLTQNALGRKVGISQQSINNYENERREPKLKTWQKLADYFGVSVSYLQGIDEDLSNYDLFIEENRKKNFSRYDEYALAHNIKVDPINRKIVNGWVTNIAPPDTNELKVLVGLQDHFSFEEAQKLVADGKTKELISEALPSAYLPTVKDRVRNHQQLNSDGLQITNQSLVDMLCLAYQQYRGQVSSDFIKNKTNLTTAKKKKILDDFSDLLEREITQDLDK